MNKWCRYLVAACVLSSCGISSAVQEEWAELCREMSAMREALAINGAYVFVTNAATPRASPHIHSQCWVDWLPKEDVKRRMYEQEKRDFGLDVLKCLEEYAWGIDEEDLSGYRKSAGELLSIAEWLNTSAGYGNYLLKRWAENLALIRVCRLAVDGGVGLDEIKSYFSRVGEPIHDIRLRALILNEEAPHKYSLPSFALTEESGSESLCRQWAGHFRESVRHYSRWCEDNSRYYPSLVFKDIMWDDPKYAFYIEDPVDGEQTLRDTWGKKTHYTTLCTGQMSMIHWLYLKKIIQYWEVVGELPLPDKEIVKRPGSFKGLCREGDEYKTMMEGKWRAASKAKMPHGVDSCVVALMRNEIEDWVTENCLRRRRLGN